MDGTKRSKTEPVALPLRDRVAAHEAAARMGANFQRCPFCAGVLQQGETSCVSCGAYYDSLREDLEDLGEEFEDLLGDDDDGDVIGSWVAGPMSDVVMSGMGDDNGEPK